jgi:hypothetical protein
MCRQFCSEVLCRRKKRVSGKGAAVEGPHPEYKLPSVLLKAIYEFLQVGAPPYHGHQDSVFYYAVIRDKANKMNIAVGIHHTHVQWVELRLSN